MSRIVRLTREHLSGVAELEQLCFPTEPWSESSLEVLCREHGIGYVALDEDETVLAYVGMTYAADEGSITNVATLSGGSTLQRPGNRAVRSPRLCHDRNKEEFLPSPYRGRVAYESYAPDRHKVKKDNHSLCTF